MVCGWTALDFNVTFSGIQGNILEQESLMPGIFLASYMRGQVFRGDEQRDFLKTLAEGAGHSTPQTLSNLFKQALGAHRIKNPPQLPKN